MKTCIRGGTIVREDGVLQHVNDAVLDDMADIAAEEGITSFKVYMTYDYRLDDLALMKVLARAKQAGILIAAHCENHGIVTHFREQFVKEGRTQAKRRIHRRAGRRAAFAPGEEQPGVRP